VFVEDFGLFGGVEILVGELVFKPEEVAVEFGKLQGCSKY
jgi:hypothetical protein